MKIISKEEYKARRRLMKQEALPHMPGQRPRPDAYTTKVIAPEEVKTPQTSAQESE